MRASASISRKSPRPRARAPATFAAKADASTSVLLLFDIDGTLVLSGGAGARAMSLAFAELFGNANVLDGISMAGRTDHSILCDMAAAHGAPLDPSALARFPDVYARRLAEEIDKPGPRKGVMPGVRQLLDTLSPRDDVFLALLTGNYEVGARLKLEYFDLWRYFRCGAFGDAASNRNALLARATAHVVECGGPAFAPRDVVVIGDTPLDIACARSGGARSVGVATGSHTADDLRAAGADVVFDDLSDTNAVLKSLQLTRK